MEVRLSPERERFVRRLVDGGGYAAPAEVVEAALRLLEAQAPSCPLRQAVALGLEQALAGRSVALTVDDVVHRSAHRGRRS